MAILWLFILFLASSTCFGSDSTLESSLLSQLKKIYGTKEIVVRFYNLPKDLAADRNIKGVFITKLPDQRGDGQALIETEEKVGRKRTFYVSFRVFGTKRFYVLKRDMKKGEIITADDFYEKEALLSDQTVCLSSEEILGKKLKKDVPAGTPITKEILEEAYLVKKGDIVTAKVENERMRILAKALSLEKGKMGDVIRLRNLSSGKEIVGIVSGEKEVRVFF